MGSRVHYCIWWLPPRPSASHPIRSRVHYCMVASASHPCQLTWTPTALMYALLTALPPPRPRAAAVKVEKTPMMETRVPGATCSIRFERGVVVGVVVG